MKKLKTIIILTFIQCISFGQTPYQKDFEFYWKTINENFAYFDRQKINWENVKMIYQPLADTITSVGSFIRLLEDVNNEFYNGHIFLNTNTNSSNRTIPTGSDIKVSYLNNKFVVSELRQNYNAEQCGMKTGMIIYKFNDIPIEKAINKFLPKSFSKHSNEMYEYAANMLLAGTHNTYRKITVELEHKEKDFFPDAISNKTEENKAELIESKLLDNNIGYIKIENSLGNEYLIAQFDSVLDKYINTKALIIDLRETPSGGNTTIARAILGRFIDKELPYQKHIYTIEEKETGIKRTTLELVSPRNKIYTKPVYILVGNWTGSMGEGIAIGFEGMKRAKILGTKMAGLLGEIYSFETPNLKIPFSIPSVQLQTVFGQPREYFIPKEITKNPIDLINQTIKLINKNYR